MKKYIKPEFVKNEITFRNIASLNDWLVNQGAEYADAGITTYIVES